MRAAESQAQGGQSALAELCRLFWYPLYIFARRRAHSSDDAQDLTQVFFLHVVEHRAFRGVGRLKHKALLREEVGRTLSGPAEFDEEIHALCQALVLSEGRLGP
jgi:hypothetical protein